MAGTGSDGVLFAGPAGVGKTRLANEVLRIAALAGHRTARVQANRSVGTIPFGAFAPLLPAGVAVPGGETDALWRAAEAITEPPAPDGLRLVLGVDDAQELDPGSAALLHQLVVRGRIFAVVTVRTGDPAPDPVLALWKDQLLTRLDVHAFDGRTVGDLVAAMLGGPVDGGTASILAQISGGNALFLREVVESAIESGGIHDAGGIWRLRSRDLPASPRLVELVEHRFVGLEDDDLAALELVAVGEPVAVDLLESLTAPARVEQLERRGLIDVQAESGRYTVRLAHPVYGEAIRARLPERRRQRLLEQLTDAIERRPEADRTDSLRAAVWRLECGNVSRPELLVEAALEARLREDFELVGRLARVAWEQGAGIDAAHLLGETLDHLGEHEEAELVLAAAGSGTDAATVTDQQRTLVALARGDNLFRGLARGQEAERVVLEAEAQVTDPQLRNELAAQRATFALFSGDLRRVFTIVEPFVRDGADDDRAYAQGGLQAAVALAIAGRTDEAILVADHAFEVRIRLGDQVQMAGAGIYLVARALALVQAGRLAEAEGTAQAGYDGAVARHSHDGQAWFACMLGSTALNQGKVVSAARWFREAAVVWDELDHPSARWGYGGMAHALALAGDHVAAHDALADLDAAAPTTVRMMDSEIERGRAWAAAQRGEVGRALTILRDATGFALDRGMHSLASATMHDLARLGDLDGAAGLLELSSDLDGAFAPARVAHVEGLTRCDGDQLDVASEMFEAAGALLFAAEAAASASAQHQRAGLSRKVSASAQRSRLLAEQCEGARTAPLVTGAEATPLTRREREVASLAARGLSSREIADALFVSARTVENHLQHAYEKLGVRGRSELAEIPGLDTGAGAGSK
ncbi:MAG: transcriptional regulator, LuxR family [Actinomycetia bacterium]|nr:transcriptional regulator, LuxR family [Actinomycetes bacterium]